MAKTAKVLKLEARRGRKKNYFTRAISALLDTRQEGFRRGKWREIADAAELKPKARNNSRAAR